MSGFFVHFLLARGAEPKIEMYFACQIFRERSRRRCKDVREEVRVRKREIVFVRREYKTGSKTVRDGLFQRVLHM